MYSGCVGGVDRLEGAGGSRGNFGLLSSHASGIILIIMMKKPIGSISDWFIFLMETILASFRNHNKMSKNRLIFFRSRKWTCLLWKKRFDRMRKIQGKLLSTFINSVRSSLCDDTQSETSVKVTFYIRIVTTSSMYWGCQWSKQTHNTTVIIWREVHPCPRRSC